MVKPTALQPRRTASATDPVMAWLGASPPRASRVRGVQLQDGWDLAGEFIGTGLDHSQRRGVGRQAGVDGKLEVIVRVIGVRVDGKASCRAMLEPLVDRQNDHLAGAAKPTLHQHAGKIALYAGAVRPVIVEDGLNLAGDFHGALRCFRCFEQYRPTCAAMSPSIAVCRQSSRRGVCHHL